jgi:hypothetical protein
VADILDLDEPDSNVLDLDAPAPKGRSLWSVLGDAMGAPQRWVDSGLGAALRPIVGESDQPDLTDLMTGKGPQKKTASEIMAETFVPRKDTKETFGRRVLRETVGNLTGLSGLTPTVQRQAGYLRDAGYGNVADAMEAGTREGVRVGTTLVTDPLNLLPIGALSRLKHGATALRALSGGMAVAGGVGTYSEVDQAIGEYRKAGRVTPEVAEALVRATASGAMTALAGAGALHGGGKKVDLLREMEASAAAERLAAVKAGTEPNPDALRALEALRSGLSKADAAPAVEAPSRQPSFVRPDRAIDESPLPAERPTPSVEDPAVRELIAADFESGGRSTSRTEFTPRSNPNGSKKATYNLPLNEFGNTKSKDIVNAIRKDGKGKLWNRMKGKLQEVVDANADQFERAAHPEADATSFDVDALESDANLARPALSGGGEPIRVNLEQLDREWATADPDGYIARADPAEVARMRGEIDSGGRVEMPEVGLGSDGKFHVNDGRKRLAALRDAGVKEVEVWTDPDSAPALRNLLAIGEREAPVPFTGGNPNPELVLDMPTSEYVARIPKVNDDTPFRPVLEATEGEYGKVNRIVQVSRELLTQADRIHPEFGRILRGMVRDTELWRGRAWSRAEKARLKLTRAEQQNVIDPLQNNDRSSLTGPMKEYGDLLEDIWKHWQSEPAGVEFLRKRGVGYVPNYAPHLYKDPIPPARKLELYAQHLMEQASAEGGVMSMEKAIRIARGQRAAALRWADNELNVAGSMAYRRLGSDLPYRKDAKAIPDYAARSVRHLAELKWLGDERSKLTNTEGTGILDGIADPQQRQLAENLVDILVGKDYGTMGRALGTAMYWSALTKLVKSAILQPSTLKNIGTVRGSWGTTKDLLKILMASSEKRQKMRLDAMSSGSLDPNLSGEFGRMFGSGNKYLHGVGKMDMGMRIISDVSGRSLMGDAMAGNKHALDMLEMIGFFKEAEARGIARADALAPNQDNIDLAAKVFSDYTQFRTDSAHMPPWMDHPFGRLGIQFGRFLIREAQFTGKIAKWSIQHKNPRPFIRMLTWAIAVGTPIRMLQDFLSDFNITLTADAETNGNTWQQWMANPEQFFQKISSSKNIPYDPKHKETLLAGAIQSILTAGTLGIMQFAADRIYGEPTEVAGPVVSDAYKILASGANLTASGWYGATGRPEEAKKALKKSGQSALKALGPYGDEAAQEWLGDVPREYAGILGIAHDIMQGGDLRAGVNVLPNNPVVGFDVTNERRREGRAYRQSMKVKGYYEDDLDQALEDIGMGKVPEGPPSVAKLQEKTAGNRKAAMKAKAKAELMRALKYKQYGDALLLARKADREWRLLFKDRGRPFYRFVSTVQAARTVNPAEIEEWWASTTGE